MQRLARTTLYQKLLNESETLKTNPTADTPTTRWWLERKLREEYSTRVENDNTNTNITVDDISKLFQEPPKIGEKKTSKTIQDKNQKTELGKVYTE